MIGRSTQGAAAAAGEEEHQEEAGEGRSVSSSIIHTQSLHPAPYNLCYGGSLAVSSGALL
jgi:hypothetical protein